MNDSLEFEVVNSMFSVVDVLERLFPERFQNISTYEDFFLSCPFHVERTPSFRVYVKRNFCKCFGLCSRSWDSVGLYAEAYGISQRKALAEMSSWSSDLSLFNAAFSILNADNDFSNRKVELYGTEDRAFAYLKTRGISRKTVSLYDIIANEDFIAFPHKDLSGLIRCYTYRYFDRVPRFKFEFILGEIPFGLSKVKFDEPLHLTESVIDALSLIELGFNSISIKISSRQSYLAVLSDFPIIFSLFDGDKAGKEASRYFSKAVNSFFVPVCLPDGADVNDLHLSGILSDFVRTNTAHI